jgi:hypothetical protein
MTEEERKRLAVITANRNYNKMVENVDFSTAAAKRKAHDNKYRFPLFLFPFPSFHSVGVLTASLSSALNMLIGAGTLAVVGWYLGHKAFGRVGGAVGALVGLIGSLFLETILVILYAETEGMAHKKAY